LVRAGEREEEGRKKTPERETPKLLDLPSPVVERKGGGARVDVCVWVGKEVARFVFVWGWEWRESRARL
jgi:hypothetical protein